MDRTANAHHRDYTYDDQGRLTQLSNGSLATFSYGYDNPLLGQRTSMTSALGVTNYSYDSNYQLIQANYPNTPPFNGEVHSWTYDNIGNRLTNTVNGVPANYTYYKNGSNQLNGQRLQSDGVKTYTYDNNGNMTSDGTNTYTWDYENRLVGITGPGLTASYSYDYLGRRASKTVNGATTTYLYDGQNLIRESGTTTADFVFGPGMDEPLAVSRAGLISYYNVDALGSVASLSDSAGTLQNSYDYDAWGVLRNQTGSTPNSFLYTARESAEAGLYFYRARYYSPLFGKFITEDPRDLSHQILAGLNHYVYVINTPVLARDPMGLQAAGGGSGFTVDESCDCVPPTGGPGGGGGGGGGGPNIKDVISREVAGYCQRNMSEIKNPWVKACVSIFCSLGSIKCKDDCQTNVAGLGTTPVTFCTNTWWEYRGGNGPASGDVGRIIIHEWAHNCGWEDCGGGGVPDNHKCFGREVID